MRVISALLFLTSTLTAQTPGQTGLAEKARDLRAAIQNGSFTRATEIADDLDEKIQTQHRLWLVRDARERVDELLSWLPVDTESFWVNQEPFEIRSQDSLSVLYGRPTQAFSVDRLMALNDGRTYRALANQTVRLVAAATRGVRAPQSGSTAIPGVMPAQDVVYFYFFTAPLGLPSPDESIEGSPVWQASAMIDAGGPFEAGVPRAQREDKNWIALARPELLVLANRKELLREMLRNISHGSATRALSADLPEWKHTDRTASFWGLRHYTAASKPKQGDRGCATANLPQPDCDAVGVTMRFNSAQHRLEVRYLSDRQLDQNGFAARDLRRQFQIDLAERGVWRLVSDVQQRGKWPVDFSLTMLGFGDYR